MASSIQSSPVFQLAYISRINCEPTEKMLTTLLAKARAFNQENGITGFLTLNDTHFFQLLEGDESEVIGLYDKIRRDPRHRDVVIVFTEPKARRLLPHWHMHYFLPHELGDRQPLDISAIVDNGVSTENLQKILLGLRFPRVARL